MKAAVIDRYGKSDVVQLRDIPEPTPGPTDLLVEVHAAGINPVDFKIRDGKVKTLLRYRFPLVLGNELSGVVVAVGERVTRFKKGDAVFARLGKSRIGAFAEQALVDEADAAKKPERLSHLQAASIPLVGLTSWQALIDIGKLAAGQTALIHAGSGGVGTFAIQLAKHLGARVATTVGARNVELVKSLGADQAIDYRRARFEEVVKDCDVVLDTQGGETLERSFLAVKRGGTVVTIGGIPDGKFARAWGLNPFLVVVLSLLTRKVTRLARKREAHFEYLFMHASGEQLAAIGVLLEAGTIRPVVDRTFPLAEVKEALAYVESGRAVGKVVLTTR